jgi:probable phosphoglycerate mutase
MHTMTTVLYLIRHAETDWNVDRRWQGHTDIPLNETGLRQAHLLAQRLHTDGIHFDVIYSSDLSRAYRTAWEIGYVLKQPVQLWPPLREMDVGKWGGLTRQEIMEQYADDYARLQQGEDIPRGGGESRAMLRKRITETVETIVARHPGKTLALVTHGGPVRVIVDYICEKYGAELPTDPHPANTSISVVRCHSYVWELERFNDTAHLQAAPAATDYAAVAAGQTESPEERSL